MRIQILFILFFVIFINGHSQVSGKHITPYFENMTVEDGLSQGFISSVIQDKQGFMWFGTHGGLNRYDGYHIKLYSYHADDTYSLPDNAVQQVAEDDNGNMWVVTRNKGIILFDRKTEKFYPVILTGRSNKALNFSWGLECHGAYLILHDNDGNILIYNTGGLKPGLYDENSLKNIPLLVNLNQQPVFNKRKIQGDIRFMGNIWMPDNSIWTCYTDSIYVYTPDRQLKKWTMSKQSLSMYNMSNQVVYSVFPIKGNNQIAIVGSSALCVYDLTHKRIIFQKSYQPAEGGFEGTYVYHRPFEGVNGEIIFLNKEGYHSFNPIEYSFINYQFEKSGGKADFSAMSKFADRDGILWLGTGGYGINMYNTRRELFHTDPEDAFSFVEDSLHNFYVAFRSGLCLYDSKTKTRKPFLPVYLTNKNWDWFSIWQICNDGNLWISANLKNQNIFQFLQYNPTTQTLKDHTSLFIKNYIAWGDMRIHVFTDKEKNIWQVVYDNLLNIKVLVANEELTGSIAEYTFPISKQVPARTFSIYKMYEDAGGNIWFATNKGLYRLDIIRRTWIIFKNNPKDSNSLSIDALLSICPDPAEPDKFFWIGTNGGGFNKFELATGKCKRYSEEDGLPNNVVYGILDDGVGNLWMSTNKGLSCFNLKSATFRNFTKDDGLPGNEYNGGQYYKRSNGDMFFGGVNGITWFNPKEVLAATLPPNNIVFTGLSIFNKPVNFKKDSSIINKSIGYVQTITLPHDKNMFSVEFALLQYTKADKKHYKYKLDGFNKDWIDNSSSNTATFTNLDPGKYTFEVIGCNSDGIWNEKGASLIIMILPAWYQTWWFYCLVVLSSACILYAFYRYRLYNSLKLLKMRNKIASDLHDEIGSTLSSITVYSDIIEDQVQQPDLKMIAERISNSSRNTLIVMSDIVWSINPKNDRFDNILLRMKSFAYEVLLAQNRQFHFEADETLSGIKLEMNERKNFYLIFKEGLNNTIKYAEAKNVWITVKLQGKEILFTLKDDGIGFNTSDLKDGNGLINMKKRSKDLKGQLTIESRPGNGTTIKLRFPI